MAVIIIAGVLAAVAVPRLSSTSGTFDDARFYDQTLAALRYAQKVAAAQQRTVCVTFTATQLSLTYAPTYGVTTCVVTDVVRPPADIGASAAYTVVAQGGATYNAVPSDFTFDRIGRASAGQTISLQGGRNIVIEPETGYVR